MASFAVLDVETADTWPGSICQIGLGAFEGGRLERLGWLVDPGRPFDPIVSQVHGLNAARVRGAPSFAALYPEILRAIDGRTLASYGDFDARALAAICAQERLAFPRAPWVNVRELARAAWPEAPAHGLRALGAGFGIAFSDRHDAEQDALAAAFLLLRGMRALGIVASEAASRFPVPPPAPPRYRPPERRHGPVAPAGAGWGAALAAVEQVPDRLDGEVVVFTGDQPFDRAEMAARIARLGARAAGSVSGRTTLIVSGWGEIEAGGQKMAEAAARVRAGQAIRCCRATDFLALVERLSKQ